MVSRSVRTVAFVCLATLLFAGVAAAQQPRTPPTAELSLVMQFVIGAAVNLVIGAIVLAAAPDFSRSVVDDARDDPALSVLMGLGVVIGGIVVLVLFAITIIGLIVAIPGFFVYGIVTLVGTTLGAITLGAVIQDAATEGGLWGALVIGVPVTAAVGLIPLFGGLVNLLIGALGIGAMANELWTEYRGDTDGNAGGATADAASGARRS